MARKSPVTTHGEIHNRIVTEKSFSIFAAILTRTNKWLTDSPQGTPAHLLNLENIQKCTQWHSKNAKRGGLDEDKLSPGATWVVDIN